MEAVTTSPQKRESRVRELPKTRDPVMTRGGDSEVGGGGGGGGGREEGGGGRERGRGGREGGGRGEESGQSTCTKA